MPSDRYAPRQTLSSDLVHDGLKWDVVVEEVVLPAEDGQDSDSTVRREYVRHPGAVSVLAMDDDEQVLLLCQYRHPVRHELWELPAGLLDVADEPPVEAAARELWEEVDLTADRYDLLIDFFNSPGGSDEAQRVFLARGVHRVADGDQFSRTEEEAGIVTRWVPLDDAVADVLAGRVQNPGAVIAVLAAHAARAAGWSTLRPADSPWPAHPRLRTHA